MPLVKVDASFVLLKAADVSTYTAVVLPAYMPTYLPPYLLHTCLDKYPHAYQNKHTCTDIQSKPLVSRKGGGSRKGRWRLENLSFRDAPFFEVGCLDGV